MTLRASDPPAGLTRRLAAMFYDFLLLLGIGWAVTASMIVLRIARFGEEAVRRAHIPAAAGPILQLSLLAAVIFFFVWFWTRSGQTLGMQAWRLRVENLDGGRLNWRQALLRLAGAGVSLLCLGLGYLWVLLDAEKRTWHDRWSRSRVVLVTAK